MQTIADPHHRLFKLTDKHLIDMLEGAFFPPRCPGPTEPAHDFLVINPHRDFLDDATSREAD